MLWISFIKEINQKIIKQIIKWKETINKIIVLHFNQPDFQKINNFKKTSLKVIILIGNNWFLMSNSTRKILKCFAKYSLKIFREMQNDNIEAQ